MRTVAMESTGVFRVPLYRILETRGWVFRPPYMKVSADDAGLWVGGIRLYMSSYASWPVLTAVLTGSSTPFPPPLSLNYREFWCVAPEILPGTDYRRPHDLVLEATAKHCRGKPSGGVPQRGA